MYSMSEQVSTRLVTGVCFALLVSACAGAAVLTRKSLPTHPDSSPKQMSPDDFSS
jgi:hypothetical protein